MIVGVLQFPALSQVGLHRLDLWNNQHEQDSKWTRTTHKQIIRLVFQCNVFKFLQQPKATLRGWYPWAITNLKSIEQFTGRYLHELSFQFFCRAHVCWIDEQVVRSKWLSRRVALPNRYRCGRYPRKAMSVRIILAERSRLVLMRRRTGGVRSGR